MIETIKMVGKIQIIGEDRNGRRRERLGAIGVRERRREPLLCLRAAQEHDALRLRIRRGRAVLHDVMDRAKLFLGDRVRRERIIAACLAEQDIERRVGQFLSAVAHHFLGLALRSQL